MTINAALIVAPILGNARNRAPVPPEPPKEPWWKRALGEVRWRLGL